MTYKIVRKDEVARFNISGWRIVASDGRVLSGFTTKREAERLVEFFTGSACPCDQCAVLRGKDE